MVGVSWAGREEFLIFNFWENLLVPRLVSISLRAHGDLRLSLTSNTKITASQGIQHE